MRRHCTGLTTRWKKIDINWLLYNNIIFFVLHNERRRRRRVACAYKATANRNSSNITFYILGCCTYIEYAGYKDAIIIMRMFLGPENKRTIIVIGNPNPRPALLQSGHTVLHQLRRIQVINIIIILPLPIYIHAESLNT